MTEITAADVKERTAQLTREAESGGYHINPDSGTTPDLVRGLMVKRRAVRLSFLPLPAGIRQCRG